MCRWGVLPHKNLLITILLSWKCHTSATFQYNSFFHPGMGSPLFFKVSIIMLHPLAAQIALLALSQSKKIGKEIRVECPVSPRSQLVFNMFDFSCDEATDISLGRAVLSYTSIYVFQKSCLMKVSCSRWVPKLLCHLNSYWLRCLENAVFCHFPVYGLYMRWDNVPCQSALGYIDFVSSA